jgi:hypothetical protein
MTAKKPGSLDLPSFSFVSYITSLINGNVYKSLKSKLTSQVRVAEDFTFSYYIS